jgi:hypothetical protein
MFFLSNELKQPVAEPVTRASMHETFKTSFLVTGAGPMRADRLLTGAND